MAYVIGKHCSFDSVLVVTRVLKGGLTMDNYRTFPDYGLQPGQIGRVFKNREAAQTQLDRLVSVGGFDDFEILEV